MYKNNNYEFNALSTSSTSNYYYISGISALPHAEVTCLRPVKAFILNLLLEK